MTNFSDKNLNNFGIKAVTNSWKTIKNIVNNKYNNAHIKSDAGFYAIK